MATSTAQAIATVPVWDYLMNPGDPTNLTPKGLAGKKGKVTLTYSQAQSAAPVTLLGADPVPFTTDPNGFWQVNLVPNNKISPGGTLYNVEIEGYRSYLIQVTDVNVPGIGWQSVAIAILPPVGGGAPGYTLPGGTQVLGAFTIQGNLDVQGTSLLEKYVTFKAGPEWDITAYLGAPDARQVTDAAIAINTPNLTSATFGFTASDVGKTVAIRDANGAGIPFKTTVLAVIDATHATLAANAGATVAGKKAILGTDNGPALRAAYAAAVLAGGGRLTGPVGAYLVDGAPNGVTFNSLFVGAEFQGSDNTTFFYVGAGDCMRMQIVPFVVTPANRWSGFIVDVNFAQPGASGVHYGDIVGGRCDDIIVLGDGASTTTKGWWLDNRTNWTEENFFIRCSGLLCGIDWLVDINGSAFNSFGYNNFIGCRIQSNAGQSGWITQNGAHLYSSTVQIRGNTGGAGSWIMQILDTALMGGVGAGAGPCDFDIVVETTGVGAPGGLNMAVGAHLAGTGIIDMFLGGSTSVNAGTQNIQFSGWFNCPGIFQIQGEAMVTNGLTVRQGTDYPIGPGAWSDNSSLYLFSKAASGVTLRPNGPNSGANQFSGSAGTWATYDGSGVARNTLDNGSGGAQFKNALTDILDTGVNFIADTPSVANKRTRIDFRQNGAGQWLIVIDRNVNNTGDFNIYDSIRGGPALAFTPTTDQAQFFAQVYPGAEAGGLQLIGGFLHSTGVPSNANGNNNDWCISDNHHLYTRTGGVWVDMTAAANSQSTPANPALTASLVGVMMGVAGAFTPVRTGQVQISISGDMFNSVVADGVTAQVRTGTGTAPVNGAALTGTARGNPVAYTAAVAATKSPFSITVIVTGLTLGTAIWIDLGVAAVTGGNASVENLTVTAVEI